MDILIGNKHEQQFESIYRLVQECQAAFRGYGYSAGQSGDDRYVADRNNRYYYDAFTDDVRFKIDEEHSAEVVEEGFYADGASWFRCFRNGERSSSAVAEWFHFIEEVATLYHRKYSIVEYKPRSSDHSISDDDAFELTQEVIRTLYNITLPRRGFAAVADDSKTDIYMLSLRLAIDGGAGESVRILGKVYFKGKTIANILNLTPLPVEEAKAIDAILTDPNMNDGNDNTQQLEVGNPQVIRDNALNALQNLVNNAGSAVGGMTNDDDTNFVDYFLYSKEDEDIISKILEQTLHGQSDLTCRELKVLGISHFVWNIRAFNCKFDKIPNLRVTFGINNSMSLKCLACSTLQNEQYIVKDDEILLKKEAPVKSINRTEITEENLNILREFGIYNDHLKKIECRNIGVGEVCTCYRCESDYFIAKSGGKERPFCVKCHRPEVISFIGDEPTPTTNMRFSFTDLKMIPAKESVVCEFCGRNIGSRTDGKCPGVCAKIAEYSEETAVEELATARKCYKKYVGAIPLFARMKFAKKYAVEDAGVVIFRIGDKFYKFDKMHTNDKGQILKSATFVTKY